MYGIIHVTGRLEAARSGLLELCCVLLGRLVNVGGIFRLRLISVAFTKLVGKTSYITNYFGGRDAGPEVFDSNMADCSQWQAHNTSDGGVSGDFSKAANVADVALVDHMTRKAQIKLPFGMILMRAQEQHLKVVKDTANNPCDFEGAVQPNESFLNASELCEPAPTRETNNNVISDLYDEKTLSGSRLCAEQAECEVDTEEGRHPKRLKTETVHKADLSTLAGLDGVVKATHLPLNFDREVFSHLPSDLQSELLQGSMIMPVDTNVNTVLCSKKIYPLREMEDKMSFFSDAKTSKPDEGISEEKFSPKKHYSEQALDVKVENKPGSSSTNYSVESVHKDCIGQQKACSHPEEVSSIMVPSNMDRAVFLELPPGVQQELLRDWRLQQEFKDMKQRQKSPSKKKTPNKASGGIAKYFNRS